MTGNPVGVRGVSACRKKNSEKDLISAFSQLQKPRKAETILCLSKSEGKEGYGPAGDPSDDR